MRMGMGMATEVAGDGNSAALPHGSRPGGKPARQ
jgi:hypothetical protein